MKGWMRVVLVAVALTAAVLPSACGAQEERRPNCLSEDESRQAMQTRTMIPPVRAVEAAVRAATGESVGIRLCRRDAGFAYDVVVLRHDGHLIHVFVDAGSGSLLPSRGAK